MGKHAAFKLCTTLRVLGVLRVLARTLHDLFNYRRLDVVDDEPEPRRLRRGNPPLGEVAVGKELEPLPRHRQLFLAPRGKPICSI